MQTPSKMAHPVYFDESTKKVSICSLKIYLINMIVNFHHISCVWWLHMPSNIIVVIMTPSKREASLFLFWTLHHSGTAAWLKDLVSELTAQFAIRAELVLDFCVLLGTLHGLCFGFVDGWMGCLLLDAFTLAMTNPLLPKVYCGYSSESPTIYVGTGAYSWGKWLKLQL